MPLHNGFSAAVISRGVSPLTRNNNPRQLPSLVGRLTLTFLGWAACTYLAVLAGMLWAADYVIEASLEKQAIRLAADFAEMGVPILQSENKRAVERIQRFTQSNEDVLYVRYFNVDDVTPQVEYWKKGSNAYFEALPSAVTRLYRTKVVDTVTLTTHQLGLVTRMRAVTSVRAVDANDQRVRDNTEPTSTNSSPFGYMEVGIDIEPSRFVVLSGVFAVALLLTLVLFLTVFFGRRHVRNSLASLLQLQEPLKQMAAGNFHVMVEQQSRDREIATVCDGVNAAIAALRQRDQEKEDAMRARLVAESANQAKSQFLAHMSHEIRTPLNGIMGFLGLFSNTSLSDQQRDYVHTIEASAKTLLTVINDILDFSKIDAGKITLEKVKCDLKDLFEDVVLLHAPNADKKGLDLNLIYSHTLATRVFADPARLAQILSNLVSNAIKFTEQGTIDVQVDLLKESDEDLLIEVAVQDSGVGITANALGRLFQAFTQADSSTTRKFGGTGLGLVISKRLVELMGGQITVQSQENEGTRFVFSLSLSKQLDNVPAPPLVEMLVSRRLLIVTPSVSVYRAFAENLARWRVKSDTSSTAEAAITHLTQTSNKMTPLAAVIFDSAIVDLTPTEFAKRVASCANTPAIPLILLGGISATARTGGWKSAGFAGFISKPAKGKDLCHELLKIFFGVQKTVATAPPKQEKLKSLRVNADPHVLIVDDNEINRRLAKILVDQLGGKADMAENGAEAIAAFTNARYDFVLMDVQMPIMDGIEATTRIRELESGQGHTIVIAVTADALSGDRERFLAAGMDEYLSKPLSEAAFIGVLRKFGLITDVHEGTVSCGTQTAPIAVSCSNKKPILDSRRGVQLSLGNQDTWQMVMVMLFEQLPRFSEELRIAIRSGDTRSMATVAHKLSGASSYCGTIALNESAQELEALAKQNEILQALPKADALLRHIDQLLKLKATGPITVSDPIYA